MSGTSSDVGAAVVPSPPRRRGRQESVDFAADAVMAALMEIQFQSTVALNKLTKLMVEYRMATTDDLEYKVVDKP